MIVSEKYKFVFMCIPKTGTMMMEQILKPYGGEYKAGGKWARHPNTIPQKYKDYFIFCIVRNPYSRAVSLWFSAIASWPRFDYGIVKTCGKEFVPFLQMLNTPKVNGGFGGLPMVSMSSFLGKIQLNRTLRFEHLEDDITTLPFWEGDSPTLKYNVRGHLRPHWSHYFRDYKNAELVQQWAEQDFERFGYDTKIPIDKNSARKTMATTSPCVCGSGKRLGECCNEKQIQRYFDELFTNERES